jgi:alpha-tubulin suppressor-like RCC1 family protein
VELAPVPVVGGVVFASLSAGFSHTCGMSTSGGAYCWGNSDEGELGIGPTDALFIPTPTPVAGGLSFWAISAGVRFTCALATSGAAYCWGFNGWGQLGDGTLETRFAPVPVSGGLLFDAITAGNIHSCGLTPNQAAHCWGDNGAGQLGNPGVGASTTPVPVSGGLTIRLISAGQGHTCALTSGGVAYCWGNNFAGEVGDGTSLNVRSLPTAVLGWSTLP